jgi:hypothetical protein
MENNMSALTTLKSMSHNDLKDLAHKLNAIGFASGSDAPILGGVIAEEWCSRCTGYIKTFGYKGWGIKKINNGYSPVNGTVYAIYDLSRKADAIKEISKLK